MTDKPTSRNRGVITSALLIILGVLLGAWALAASGGGATYIFAIIVGAVLITTGVVLIALSISRARKEAAE